MKSLIKRWACLLLIAISGLANAQSKYPDRPITWVVPFSAGSFSDIFCRTLAPEVSAQLHQPLIIENQPGAGATIGTARVKSAPADGYTILYAGSAAFASNVTLMKVSYDPVKDFEPITMLGYINYVLAVNAALPVNTFAELVAYSKAHPGKLNYGSPGNGTSSHLSMELIKASTGIEMRHVPYKGSTPAVTDLVGGQVDLMMDPYASLGPFVRNGKLKALAVTGSQRMRELPNVPTFTELGVRGFDVSLGWFGLVAPAGTPKDAIAKLNAAFTVAIQRTAPKLLDLNVVGAPGTPEAFRTFVEGEIPRYAKIITSTGIKLE